jgi:glycine cleavage system H lipoate-binding protein
MKKLCINFKIKIVIVVVALLIVSANFSLFLPIFDNSNQYSYNTKYNFLKNSSSEDDFEYDWNLSWGGIYDDAGREVATDSQNKVYLVGWTDLTGSDNCAIIISKYNINGQVEWVKTWGGINDDKGHDIYIDASDNIYIVGCTKSLGDTDGDIVIIKFDTMGNEIWNKTWGGSQYDTGMHIIEDTFGNFYISGQTNSLGDVDGDALLIKFNNIFEEQWNVTWGGSEPDIANKVELDSNNYLYVVGHSESLDPSPGESDVFLLKYNSSGNFEWERDWGTSYSQRGNSLAIDSDDNIYITGYTFGHPASSGKGFLLKYDSSGTYQWERIWGVDGQYGNYFYRIIIDDKDDLYISGCTKTYGIPNNYDALLLNYDTSGNQNWFKYWAGIGFDATPGICMDTQSNIYIVGNTDTDSVGGYDILLIKFKNTLGPEITIISPDPNNLYSTIPPDFNINIDIPDYDFTWYSLDGGSTNIYSNETTGTIDQTEWDKQGNGTVTITFYANNSLGNVGQAEVTVRKDILAPLININSPIENHVFGVDAPGFDLTILEHEIDTTWYTLDYGNINVSFSGSAGIIDQTEWGKKGGGTVPIRFYANDSFGNVDFSEVVVVKDLISPIVSINSPNNNELFGSSPPNFDITVTESNPDSMWYTLDSGATNVTFGSLTGTIDQTEWDKQGNGTVTIKFYVKDEGENEGFAEIIVRKDINIPLIIINAPITNDIYGLQSPQYDIFVVEPNIDTMWYTLDNGITNVSFTELTGTINQIEWDKFGDGIVIIRFYIRDKGDSEAFAEVSVTKDLIAPIVTINEPEFGEIFVDISPLYSIIIDETSLYSFWYSLDDGQTNYSISELTGAIDQSAWDSLSDGHITLRFYATLFF